MKCGCSDDCGLNDFQNVYGVNEKLVAPRVGWECDVVDVFERCIFISSTGK